MGKKSLSFLERRELLKVKAKERKRKREREKYPGRRKEIGKWGERESSQQIDR